LNRQVSPLLHDYKPSTGNPEQQTHAGRWFAFGLLMPLLAVGVILFVTDAPNETLAIDAQSSTHTAIQIPAKPVSGSVHKDLMPAPAPAPAPQPESADSPAVFHPPLLPAEPEYDSLILVVRRGDTLDHLFRTNGLDLGQLAAIVRLPEAAKPLRMVRPGDKLSITHDKSNIISIDKKLTLTSSLQINREKSGFVASIKEHPVEIRKRHAYGRINSSLFESGSAAGLPDNLIMNLAGIFAWDIDFVLDIRAGDDYYILYEDVYQDGQFVATGEIVAAEFNNHGHSYRAIRFIDKEGRSDYYTPQGNSVRKAFLRAPVDFTRISSSFNPHRRHPILNTIRAHRGVDYAAPEGTPIKAAGDGKVIFRGRKGGYGNAIILQHGGNITTLYGHMSGFAKQARRGRRVRQGQVIGFVGSTGLATAAHLHYEYRLNGVHRNPRTVKLPRAEPIKQEYWEQFLAQAQPLLDELLQYKRTQIASLPLY